MWEPGAVPCPGMGVQPQRLGVVVGGSRVRPEHTAEHVFPAERQRVPRSCRVTLQSAGHGCALEGIRQQEGGPRGLLISSPFLVVI